MSENVNEALGDVKQAEWRALNEFASVHQDGWTIARYMVMGNQKQLPWIQTARPTAPFPTWVWEEQRSDGFTHAGKVELSCTLLFL